MIRRVIDISHYEDPVDFKKVAADGIVAIIAKATQGTTWVDPAYAKFKNAAAEIQLPSATQPRKHSGLSTGEPSTRIIPRASDGKLSTKATLAMPFSQPSTFLWGSYHFGTGANVQAQVDHYLATTKPKDNELVCLDFEANPTGSGMNLMQARQFVRLFGQQTGRYPVLYGGAWLKEQLNGKPDAVLSKCPLWIAQYAAKATLPPGWKRYALWQYTDGESGPDPHVVSGIGKCDRNCYGGTITQLREAWPFVG
jgi:lysozyme